MVINCKLLLLPFEATTGLQKMCVAVEKGIIIYQNKGEMESEKKNVPYLI